MHKTTLVLILIFFNIVPLIAGINIFDWFRRKPKTTTATPAYKPSNNRTLIRPSCKGGNGKYIFCVYTDMCNCPRPQTGGYIRTTEYRWFYNNRTRKCEAVKGAPGGCNNFDDKFRCMIRCELRIRFKRFWQRAKRGD
uniref:Putative monolaris n=1 Tax=Rhipicephalus pulchellus TaxID=72859 RepID=L7LSR2_RHIPC